MKSEEIIHTVFPLLGDTLAHFEAKYKEAELPKISIIIPTCNNAPLISITLDSVLTQDYPSFEVIIVDSSTDRTLEIIKDYHSDKIRILSVDQCPHYEMLNKGLSQASGSYINCLFPGDFYIYRETLKYMMSLALEHNLPQLVFCGTLLRDGETEAKLLYRGLSLDLLRRGQQPTSLQACWFRTDALQQIGKFNPNYSLRGGYELLCRFCLDKNFQFASAKRVLTDYDLRSVTRQMVLTHFWETLTTIYHYFGLWDTLWWILFQKDTRRFVKLWLKSLKVAFSGR